MLSVNSYCGVSADDEYASLRVLFVHHTNPSYFAPIRLSNHQIICGPFCENRSEGGKVHSLRTPLGYYDINPIVEMIPKHQRPDLIVVRADASRNNFPTGIGRLNIPKILMLGDTGHMVKPLRTMLNYAVSQPFDAYVTPHLPRHSHFFAEAGIKNLFWIPALSVQTFDAPCPEKKTTALSFVGQVGAYHPNRVRMLQALKKEGLPIQVFSGTQEEAFRIYANSQITLNYSMNGDLNLRVFEVLAAGGFLLSDDIEWQSGRDLLFRDGEHLVLWHDFNDLALKIRYYLAHPQEALRISRAGRAAFWRSHSPARKRRQLLDLVFKGWMDPTYDVYRDPRCMARRPDDMRSFFSRLGMVEYLQTLHCHRDRVPVAFFPGIDPIIACDLADLPRMNLVWLNAAGHDMLRRNQVEHQVRAAHLDMLAHEPRWAAIVMSAEEFLMPEVSALFDHIHTEAIVISDLLGHQQEHSIVARLGSMGYRMDEEDRMTIFLKAGFFPERSAHKPAQRGN